MPRHGRRHHWGRRGWRRPFYWPYYPPSYYSPYDPVVVYGYGVLPNDAAVAIYSDKFPYVAGGCAAARGGGDDSPEQTARTAGTLFALAAAVLLGTYFWQSKKQ